MKGVVVCLLVAVYLTSNVEGGENIYRTVLHQLSRFVKDLKESIKARSDVGQSPACVEVLVDPQFLTCNRYLDNFETITIQGAEDFCNSDCASTLMNAARVCGLESEVNTTLILEMCAHQDVGNHLFCLVTFETFISSEPDPSSDYVQCIASYDGEGPCPNECKHAEDWVTANIGCCYRVALDFASFNGDTEGLLTDRYWNSCGKKEPPLCPIPRVLPRVKEEVL